MSNPSYLPNEGKGFLKILQKRGRNYGNHVLVSFVKELGAWNKKRWPEAERLQIGDLSREAGGKTLQHKSHQNGLDVDIVYLRTDFYEEGTHGDYWEHYFVVRGKLVSKFDLKRNAELLAHAAKDPRVKMILVDTVIRRALKKEYQKTLPKKDRDLIMPKLVAARKLHKTHFHVRLHCPEKDLSCKGTRIPRTWGSY